jgi:hypothetical protein|eukprot:30612-Pelagococcus_subviridis.AAC.20
MEDKSARNADGRSSSSPSSSSSSTTSTERRCIAWEINRARRRRGRGARDATFAFESAPPPPRFDVDAPHAPRLVRAAPKAGAGATPTRIAV